RVRCGPFRARTAGDVLPTPVYLCLRLLLLPPPTSASAVLAWPRSRGDVADEWRLAWVLSLLPLLGVIAFSLRRQHGLSERSDSAPLRAYHTVTPQLCSLTLKPPRHIRLFAKPGYDVALIARGSQLS
ncbi:hypothetical protein EDB92DRAFT_1896396, partial [Lactarius akahatsu]